MNGRSYASLFEEAINGVVARLNGILMAHGDVVPLSLKLAILRTNSQLGVEQRVFMQIPQLISLLEDQDAAFWARFRETIRPLAALARQADRERTTIGELT